MGISSSLPTASKFVQQVSAQSGAVWTTTTQMPKDDTIPQSNEGGELLTLAITPKSTTNKLHFKFNCFGSTSVVAAVTTALFQDATAGALAAVTGVDTAINGLYQTSFQHTMDAGTLSSTTFKVRIGMNGAGTLTVNGQVGGRLYGGVASYSLTITEYAV